jgi:hypothetical protein
VEPVLIINNAATLPSCCSLPSTRTCRINIKRGHDSRYRTRSRMFPEMRSMFPELPECNLTHILEKLNTPNTRSTGYPLQAEKGLDGYNPLHFYKNQIRYQYIQFIFTLKEACPGVELGLGCHSRLMTILRFIYASVQVYDILFSVCLKLINFIFHIFHHFVPEVLLASRLTLFGLSPFISFGFCNHCNLSYFL